MMAKSLMKRWIFLVVLACGLATAAQAGVDLPKLSPGKGDKCVEDTDFMRRNHMDLLKHHRDDTMRLGIRTTKHSLKGCVECHASEKTGSVAASKEDFCMACHSYASVKLDCWACHATKPGKKVTGKPVAKPTMPADHAHHGHHDAGDHK